MRKRQAKQNQKVKRSRTRSGCFTCRDRHMKCDEQLPVCQNCVSSKRRCYRGIRLNFSSYNYYDPRTSGVWHEMLVPPYYRILDQSIPVSKLYKNGYDAYKPYRHLHLPKDLAEAEQALCNELQTNQTNTYPVLEIMTNPAESDFLLQQDDLSHFFDSWFSAGSNTDTHPVQGMRNRFQENVDIKRILMNPELHDKQLGGVMHSDFNEKMELSNSEPFVLPHRKTSFASHTTSEFHTSPGDADSFIGLIHHQKYFWLLDLFNDLRVWESCIPNYCVRLFQASEMLENSDGTERFLFDCLLLCNEDVGADTILELNRVQLSRWREFEKKDVTFVSYQNFEKILISVVLILQAVFIQATKPGFTMDQAYYTILANQGRLIHQLTARFKRVHSTILKRLSSTVFTTASFQAIVILRFFLKKRVSSFGINCDSGDRPSSESVLECLENETPLESENTHSLSLFFTLTESEVSLLCNDYQGLTFSSSRLSSDAGKLREVFWELVLRDYQSKISQQAYASSSDSELEAQLDDDLTSRYPALMPNSRCLAMNILKAYSNKIGTASATQEKCSKTLFVIFNMIEASNISSDSKAKWVRYFGWSNSCP
ncbi:hypothetical protein OXX69_005010 [Metschnikowia pulcherrima]